MSEVRVICEICQGDGAIQESNDPNSEYKECPACSGNGYELISIHSAELMIENLKDKINKLENKIRLLR